MAIGTIVPSSELEAINAMLSTNGTSPLQIGYDLSAPDRADVETAINLICSTSRGVQSKGWQFNTVRGSNLPVDDILGTIAVPSNALKVRKTVNDAQRTWDISHRGGFLWNNTEDSDIFDDDFFTDGVDCDITYGLDFTDLPEPARQYIFIAASRRYQEQTLGNADLSSFSKSDEAQALAALIDAEGLIELTTATASLKDQNKANEVWNAVSKKAQQIGWNFNSVKNVPITPDVDGFINLPDGTLRATKSERTDQRTMDLAHRGLKMFNKITNTNVFTTPDITGANGVVYVDLVAYLDRTALPQIFVDYVDIKASRQLQPQRNNTAQPQGFTEKDEYFALRDLQDSEGLVEDNSLFVNMSVYRSLFGRTSPYGSGNLT